MPWWGWLAAAVALMCCATVITVVSMMTRTMGDAMRDLPTGTEGMKRRLR